MIVREIRLENIKSFGSPAEVIRLSRGLNAVSGPNGAGKSTVLEAIGAALFQHLPYRQEAFVREGESTGTITIVVDSRLDGRTYEVVRKVGRAATHQIFDPDTQQFVARGEADVGRWLRHHLQVEAEVDLRSLFVDSIGPPQGTLTAAFLDSAQVRRAKFNRLLRVDDYENAYRSLLALESAIDADRTSVDRRVAGLEVQTRGRADLEGRRIEQRDEQVTLARRLGDLAAERETIEEVLANFDAAELRLRNAQATNDVTRERGQHAADLLRRAQSDHQTAVRATETIERLRGARDRYLVAEEALADLEGQRQARDGLRASANEWTLNRTESQGKLNGIDQSIADGERARDEIVELERRIPLQDAAESRLEAARLAKRALDDNRKQLTALHDLTERAKARFERAESNLVLASEKRTMADELRGRQLAHQTVASRIARIDQATGTVKTLRENLSAYQRQIDTLQAKLTGLEEQIGRLGSPAVAASAIESIEARHRQAVEDRAAAASHLKFARDSRIQVKGGLCPLLNESCRNIRPGITLEGHFDGEIELWHGRLARLGTEYREVDEELRAARKQREERERLDRLLKERTSAAGELLEAEARFAEAERNLYSATAIASERASVEREVQVALAALDEAREAARVFGMLPDLTRELAEARDDLNRRQRDLDGVTATIANAGAIEAEVAAATAARASIGSPREAAAHRRAAVDRLPILYPEQRRVQALVEGATSRLAEGTRALEPFADLDRLIDQHRRVRDETRAASEAFVAAQASASRLPPAEIALCEAESASATASEAIRTAAAAVKAANEAYDPNAHRTTRVRRSEIGTTLGETRAQLTAAAEEEARLDRELAALRRLELELAAERKHRDEIDAERQLAGTMRSAIRAAGPEITRQLLGKISRTATQINGDILNQAGIEVEWTADYEIVTRRQGETRGFAQLSGGEQMSAALSVRLAATRHLSRIRFAFLDEPTAHLDEARRSNLGSQIQRLQGFDQFVVISHDDTFDGLFGDAVRIVRENGRSRVLDGN